MNCYTPWMMGCILETCVLGLINILLLHPCSNNATTASLPCSRRSKSCRQRFDTVGRTCVDDQAAVNVVHLHDPHHSCAAHVWMGIEESLVDGRHLHTRVVWFHDTLVAQGNPGTVCK